MPVIYEDIIFCSFYTDDAYYTEFADKLKSALTKLGISHEISPIKKSEDDKWINICRKKVPFIYEICQRHPDKKVFWIDVDCGISRLPDFVAQSSADIIGFQRGFSGPLRLGYHLRSRFWEPCFWGINTSLPARAFIQTAFEAERDLSVFATDDYFFEEAWRIHATDLSFQIIPSKFVADKAEYADPFFFFGSSGNVSDNVGLAAQHDRFGMVAAPVKKAAPKPEAKPIAKRFVLARVLKKLWLRNSKPSAPVSIPATKAKNLPDIAPNSNIQNDLSKVMAAAKAGDALKMEATLALIRARKVLTKSQTKTVAGANSFLTYASGKTGVTLPLVWWDKPFPGNFGDWLGPLILQQSSGHSIKFVPPNGLCKTPHLISIGSIARFVNAQSIVVGAGISNIETKMEPNAHYISVRGPITARALRDNGGPVVTSFGDPGLLMSRIFPITRTSTNGRIALVRHYIHRKLFINIPTYMDELSILLSNPCEIKAFVNTLGQYDSVITSAMHIYIVCHSYGIPCALVTFEGGEDMVHGDGTKYIDYARGAGIKEAPPKIVSRELNAVDIKNITTDYKVSEEKLDEIAKAVGDGIEAYVKTISQLS